MSYQFIILGIGVAAALYCYFNGRRPLTYGVCRSWDHEAKYKEKDVECTICLDVMEPNSRFILSPCKHTFHKHCIRDYLRQYIERICPICRQPFFKISSQQ